MWRLKTSKCMLFDQGLICTGTPFMKPVRGFRYRNQVLVIMKVDISTTGAFASLLGSILDPLSWSWSSLLSFNNSRQMLGQLLHQTSNWPLSSPPSNRFLESLSQQAVLGLKGSCVACRDKKLIHVD